MQKIYFDFFLVLSKEPLFSYIAFNGIDDSQYVVHSYIAGLVSFGCAIKTSNPSIWPSNWLRFQLLPITY